MYAAIDIGSNTVQLLLSRVEHGRMQPLRGEIRTTRLGAVAAPGVLSEESMHRTALAVAEYMEIIRNAGAKQTRMTATSAVRDAKNSEALRRAIFAAAPTAPPLEILSGREEALYSYRGARSATQVPGHWPVADVGGSSSELIRAAQADLLRISADVGAVRATQNGWSRQDILSRLQASYGSQDPVDGVLGVGGTITAAAGVLLGLSSYDRAAVDGAVLSVAQLEQLCQTLAALSVAERCQYSPLLAQRGEIMVAGLWIWLSVCEILDAPAVTVTGGGLLDGVVAEMAGL